VQAPLPDAQWQAFQDVAAALAQPGQPAPAFAALDRAFARLIGHRLFTLLICHHGTGEVERVYTNQPAAYPLAGRKPMRATPWGDHVIKGRQHYLGPTRADIRWAFPDHALIESLGCGAVINLVVVHDGQVLGATAILDAEHAYDARSLALVAPFAALLIPAFQRLAGAPA